MTIENLEEALNSVKAVQELSQFRKLLDDAGDGSKIQMRSSCGVIFNRNNNDIAFNDKAIEVLKTLLDTFVERYESKFNELGLALNPEPVTPKTEDIGRSIWDELED
jgi:hypothetical protein